MPLIDHPTLKNKKIPDKNGGWYWLRIRGDSWKPVEVQPANGSGWAQGIYIASHWFSAEDIQGDWGPQINMDADEKLAAIKMALQKRDQDFAKLESEIKERGLRTMETAENDSTRFSNLEETFREEVRKISS